MSASDCIIVRNPSDLVHQLLQIEEQAWGTSTEVFVAGPYRGENDEVVTRNIFLACCVGRELAGRGLVPIVPHALGALGCFGIDDAKALKCTQALALGVAEDNGHFVGICREDFTLSEGTQAELETYDCMAGHRAVFAPWSVWQGVIKWEVTQEVGTMWEIRRRFM